MPPQQSAGVTCATTLSRLQQGIAPPLQHAAPLAQHDTSAVVFPLFIIGHLSPQQPALPSFCDIIGHLSPEQQVILPCFSAFISHLPSLQLAPSLPQHSIFSPGLASALS